MVQVQTVHNILKEEVAVVSVGHSGFSSVTPQLSFKEMMFEAASRAYAEVGINPRTDVDSFICCEEDLWEGISITDEYVPDQLGAAQRPICTISQEGLNGVANGVMQILSGLADVVVVEAHSKLSNVLAKNEVQKLAAEPYFERPILGDGLSIAGLEMKRYMHDNGVTEEQLAEVVVKNKWNGLVNPRGTYACNIELDDVLSSQIVWSPLRKMHMSQPADGCVVVVLASAEKARLLTDQPIWIMGVGWFSDTPWVSMRDLSRAVYAEGAAKMAYKMAGIDNPARCFDFAEVDDTFAHKELQHLEALGIYPMGEAGKATLRGETSLSGSMPVNPSGGSLSMGELLEANGLVRLAEAVLNLKGKGNSRLRGSEKAVVQNWRGLPTATGSVTVLGV
jgi:acetyl-CoA C-acetyltransferase